MFSFALKKNSWCRDSQYPLSFLSPLRPLWPLWPLQTGTHTNKERPVTVSRSQRNPQTFAQIYAHLHLDKGFLCLIIVDLLVLYVILAALAALGLPSIWLFWPIDCYGFKAFQPSRPNQNLAKLRGVMRKHDLTNKKTTTKTNTKTMTMKFDKYI